LKVDFLAERQGPYLR